MSQLDYTQPQELYESVTRLESAGPCRKRTFRTKRKAIVALNRIRAKGKVHVDTPRRVYQCKNCDMWHLTSADPR